MVNNEQICLLELIKILNQYRSNIIINIKHLQENYQRISIKRVQGIRDENGQIQQPWLRTKYIDNAEYVPMGKFELNCNTATINMLVQRQIKLVKSDDEMSVIEVAGLLVNDLNSFNNYTIVSDGKLNIQSLQVKISSKKLFDLLQQENILPAEDFDFHKEYTLRLDNLPLVANDLDFSNIDGLFYELAQFKILTSIISALLKGESEVFMPTQLDELKNHYLSPHIYVNFPTTNPYKDRQQAIANGSIASRISYKIDIGNKDILNLSKFDSANKFLNKLYRVYDKESGENFSRTSLAMAFKKNSAFRHKFLSSRIKITKADELMKAIFDDFLGLAHSGTVKDILRKIGGDKLVQLLVDRNIENSVNQEDMVTALTDAKIKLDNYSKTIYQEKISPLVFYIGTTGKLPQAIATRAMTAEELSTQYPNLHFSRYEQAGTFFVVGDSIISVYAHPEYYSTQVSMGVKPDNLFENN